MELRVTHVGIERVCKDYGNDPYRIGFILTQCSVSW